jgi:pyruvate kinase
MTKLLPWVKTKIVATAGPACESEERLTQLVQAGVDVFRLNFAHGEWDWHSSVFELIRRVSAGLGKPIAVLQDLSGPKLRLGDASSNTIRVHEPK